MLPLHFIRVTGHDLLPRSRIDRYRVSRTARQARSDCWAPYDRRTYPVLLRHHWRRDRCRSGLAKLRRSRFRDNTMRGEEDNAADGEGKGCFEGAGPEGARWSPV